MQFMNAFRNAWAIPLLRALLLAIPAGILAAPAAAGGLDPLLFESRPPGANPGAAAISNQVFPGHSFRLEQRAHVTALGAHLVGAAQAPGSVFAALYRIGTQDAAPGVINDHNLVATTLLEVVSNQPEDIYGTVDVILEPGWYALIVGTGRHGASAGALQVRMPAAASQATPRSWGPYSVNAGTGAASLNAARTRFMVHGTLLPPLPLPPEQFLDETAHPWAWAQGYLPAVGNGEHLAVRFSLEHAVRLERVDTWLRTLSGNVYAGIFATAGPASPLPDPHSSGYDGLALASALIQGQPGWPDEYGCPAAAGPLRADPGLGPVRRHRPCPGDGHRRPHRAPGAGTPQWPLLVAAVAEHDPGTSGRTPATLGAHTAAAGFRQSA